MHPAGHHAVSILIHALNCLLVYALFTRMTAERGRSFMVAALFAIHPLHVESVAWIAERKDVLCALFGLGALHAYISFARFRRAAAYAVMFLLFTLSLMSKAMLVTFPVLLLLLDFWPLGRVGRTPLRLLFLEKLPLLLPAALASVVAIEAQHATAALVAAAANPLWRSVPAALESWAIYLGQFIYPHDLTMFYPYVAVTGREVAGAAAVLAAITAAVWHLRRRAPWQLMGWSWFLVALVPVSGIVRVGSQAHADRYTYLPSIGVFVMAVWLIGTWAQSHGGIRYATVIAGLCLALCGALTWRQTGYWRDGFELYQHAISVQPNDDIAHNNLGMMLLRRGRYREAIPQLLTSVRLDPGFANTHQALGLAYAAIGEEPAARMHLRAAIDLSPDLIDSYLRLAESLRRGGDAAGALAVIREGLRRNPSNSALFFAQARLLGR